MDKRTVKGNASLIRRLWGIWKRFAKKLGDFQARIILIVFYFVLLAPFALLVRLLADPLAIKPNPRQRGWVDKNMGEGGSRERALRQS